jgi:hypothetical protein
MKRLLIFVLLFLPVALHAQGVRVSPSPISQRSLVAGQVNVVTVPSPIAVSFCAAPANAVPCTNKATTYTDSTLGTSCSTATQIVLDGTSACVGVPDTQGNWGVWVPPGQYTYTVTTNGTNFGPFFVTASGVTGLSGIAFIESAAPTGVALQDNCGAVLATHSFQCNNNNLGAFPVTQTICSGQVTLTTGAINSGTRATNTLTCTGLSSTTDSISCTFSGDTNAVTGYAPSATGSKIDLKFWVSTNTINVDQVNNTGGNITPGAATVNCKGLR